MTYPVRIVLDEGNLAIRISEVREWLSKHGIDPGAFQYRMAAERVQLRIDFVTLKDAAQFAVVNDISPLPGTAGFGTVLRSLHTPFLDEWSAKREEARRERDRLRARIVSTTQAGRQHECLLTAGQTAGGIKQVLPVAEIMRQLVSETETALSRAARLREAVPPRSSRQMAGT